MVQVYCDRCCKRIKNDYAETINVDFNCYGTAKFDDRTTYNLCKPCAVAVKRFIKYPKSEKVGD